MFAGVQFGEVVFAGIPNQFPLPPGGGYKRTKSLQMQLSLGKDEVIVNQSLMEALKEHYGEVEGEDVYMNMRKDAESPFIKGLYTAEKHGHLGIYKLKNIDTHD